MEGRRRGKKPGGGEGGEGGGGGGGGGKIINNEVVFLSKVFIWKRGATATAGYALAAGLPV